MEQSDNCTSIKGTSEEEEDRMMNYEYSLVARKRKNEETRREQDTDDESEEENRVKRQTKKSKENGESEKKRNIKKKSLELEEEERRSGMEERRKIEELRRIEEAVRRNTQKNKGIEKEVVEEQRKIRKEEDIGDKMGNIQDQLKIILEGISKESYGKVTVTRADQTSIKEAVFKIQNEMIEVLKKQIKMEKEMGEVKAENKEIMKGQKLEEKQQGIKYREEKQGIVSETKSGTEWELARRRRQRRSYAEACMKEGKDKIQGRQVVPGEEGWGTPEEGKKKDEVIIVRGKESNKGIMEELRKISPKEIGGGAKSFKKDSWGEGGK